MTEQKEFVRKRRYPKDVVARMGNEIYEDKIRPLVEDGNEGKIVAIDVESGDYEMNENGNEIDCVHRLLDKNPDAQIWLVRIGHDSVYRRSWLLMNGTRAVSRS